LEVTSGRWNLNAEDPYIDTLAPTSLADLPDLRLLGWTVPEVVWRPGENAELQLLWQKAGTTAERPFPILLSLTAAGEQVYRREIVPGGNKYPFTQWPDQAIVRDIVLWRLPADLETDRYALQLLAGAQTLSMGEWQIDAPPHDFAPPPVAATVVFTSPFAALVGYTLDETAVAPGETFQLELVWQALATATDSYRVFVHLLDDHGTLVTQSDAVPDHWMRPTTGWVPGEYIRDRHALTIPPDAVPPPYALRLGWYDPVTRVRLGEISLEMGVDQ
jgi:hypothetical protein